MDYNELIKRLVDCDQLAAAIEDDDLSLALEDAVDAIETLLEERDAMIEASRGNCNLCTHADRGVTVEPCVSCAYGLGMYDCWQWRGPKKESKVAP